MPESTESVLKSSNLPDLSAVDPRRSVHDPNMVVPSPEDFHRVRVAGNSRLKSIGSTFESFFQTDDAAYSNGSLSVTTKELLGLVISVVKDCEECVYYHLERCDEERVARADVLEALQIAVVGAGSVSIPLLRKAVTFMEMLPRLGAHPQPGLETPQSSSLHRRAGESR